MENFWIMAQIQAQLFLYMLAGFVARKLHFISDEARSDLTNLVFYLFLPCMIFKSFDQDITAQQLLSAGWILGVAFAVSFVSILLGKVLYLRYPPNKRQIMCYGTLVANSGFVGLPLASSAYGALGLFYASIYVIPTRIFMWSAGIAMFTKASGWTRVKKVLMNPGIIAVFIGMLRLLFKFPIPNFLNSAISGFGGCTTALALIIVGSILADADYKSVFHKDVFYLSGVRQLLLPLIALGICHLMGLDETATGVAVALTGMPVGSTAPILAQKYGADADFASKCVFVSTLLSLFTIPLISILL